MFFLLPLLFASCQKDSDPCGSSRRAVPDDIMQRIMLVVLDEWGYHNSKWGISDMNSKNIELIAMERVWESFEDGGKTLREIPIRDGDGKVVKQIPRRVEARPDDIRYSDPSRDSPMELYMASHDFRDGNGIPHVAEESYFVLKIDDGLWFKIEAKYYIDDCGRTKLKSYRFDGKRYAQESDRGYVERILIDEQKKREELKRNYPNGFPYKP